MEAKGFATAEWMEDTNEQIATRGSSSSSSSSSSTSLTTKRPSSSSLSLSDGRKRVFDPDVLRSPSGEILSDGDAPQPEGAQELFNWMEDRGCTGLQDVQLLLGGGVALRRKCQCGPLKEGQEIFCIPKDAWLMPEAGSGLEALAWRLLREVWAEEESSFAPFVRHLRGQDMSSHPIFWEEDEVEWLRPSLEGYELVKPLRARTEERLARLLARVAAEAPKVWENFEGREEALADEIRWALATVETKSIKAKDAEGEALVALCPLLGDFRLDAKGPHGKGLLSFETEGDRVVSSALKPLQPGEQLFQHVSHTGAWLLANFGAVPGSEIPGVPSDAELVESNVNENSWLPGPETDPGSYPPQTYMGTKMDLLLEHARVDLRGPRVPHTRCDRYCFVLPDEAMGKGRLLPTGRFMIADIAGMGGDVKLWMERWFVRFFRHCELESYPSIHTDDEQADEVLTMVHDTQIEVMARRTVATWMQQALLEKNQMIERIAGRAGLPIGNTDGVIVFQENQTVMAYFKAKRKDGSVGKSKKPREAVVLSLLDETVRVQFVGNKRRHEIPLSWVVSSTPLPNPKLLSEGCSPERLARGKLAITLLRCEKAITGLVMETLSEEADMLEELGNGVEGCKSRGDAEGAEKIMKVIRTFLDREQMELDEELARCLPQSLADIPSDPGHKPFLDKPLYNLPEGYVDPKLSNDIMMLGSDLTIPSAGAGNGSEEAAD